jgi:4-alpha-glucanotransferase
VLEELGILGLRVVRWARRWGQNGEPYIPLEEYGEQTVCTAAVHDSSTIREWWEREADRDAFRAFIGEPSLSDHYTSETARIILTKVAMARSRLRVFQIQDLLHLSDRWYADDPASERVNVPGSVNDFNWTYRLPAPIDEIAEDKQFISAAQELCELGAQKRNR